VRLFRQGRASAPGGFRSSSPGALILLWELLLLGGMSFPLTAQFSPAVQQADQRFEAARENYDRYRSLYQQSFFRSEQALEEVRAAIQSRDGGREDQARAAFYARAQEQMDAEREVRSWAASLRDSGRELIRALESREAEILDALQPVVLAPAVRASLEQEWLLVRQRTLEVDRLTGGIDEEVVLRPFELTRDPRDTPDDLRGKASVLEEQAATYRVLVDQLNQQIAELDRRAQQERARLDQQADLARFDSDLIPGGRLGRLPPGARDDRGGASTEDGLAQLSIVEQLEHFRGIRALAVEYEELALSQARVFRNMADADGNPG
jgi:hypothetical protein